MPFIYEAYACIYVYTYLCRYALAKRATLSFGELNFNFSEIRGANKDTVDKRLPKVNSVILYTKGMKYPAVNHQTCLTYTGFQLEFSG